MLKNKINCRLPYIILLMPDTQTQSNELDTAIYRKLSDSPLTDYSDHNPSTSFRPVFSFPLCVDLRPHLYKEPTTQSISDKMNRRGISWLLTQGWSRGFDQSCIWTAILLYYSYKSHFPFVKEEMEPIILTCLQLSSKFHESKPLETRDLLLMLNKPVTREDLRKYEERILLISDFNLVIPHYLTCLNDFLDAENSAKVHFLCELLLLKDHHIFFDKQKIGIIILIVLGMSGGCFEEETCELKQLMGDKQSKILFHKYSSHFDTDTFGSIFCATI